MLVEMFDLDLRLSSGFIFETQTPAHSMRNQADNDVQTDQDAVPEQ